MTRHRDPTTPRFVSYFRVSTDRLGRSGLGPEAQWEAVARYLAGLPGGAGILRLAAEYVEIESGKRSDRPQLAAAPALCRETGAVLVVAELDRLARDLDFLRRGVADRGDAGILVCDLPDLPPGAAGRLLAVMGSIAEFEAGRISERTRAALQAAKARRRKLGNPNLKPGDAAAAGAVRAAREAKSQKNAARTLPFIAAARAAGCRTLAEIADAMMARGILAPSGRQQWHASTVLSVERIANRPTIVPAQAA